MLFRKRIKEQSKITICLAKEEWYILYTNIKKKWTQMHMPENCQANTGVI